MDLNGDLTIRAGHVSVDLEYGVRHVGFAEGDEDEPYALFSQSTRGGPVRLELNDPLFVAEDAIESLSRDGAALVLLVAPGRAADLGFARRVVIRPAAGLTDWEPALAALARMHPIG